jgi:chromate reductase, NAD(P)H dehydrogenase (quinone)
MARWSATRTRVDTRLRLAVCGSWSANSTLQTCIPINVLRTLRRSHIRRTTMLVSRAVKAVRKPSLAFLLSCTLSTRSSEALNIAVITGTTRTEGPPLPIIGPRVARLVCDHLDQRGHIVSLIDVRELDLPLLKKPEFAYAKRQLPAQLQNLRETIEGADAYVTITPEYNHAPSPALLNLLNHFGSSIFSFKPSAIVSYSAGQWGGTRAALALRPILSELGCLPVSAMIHIAKAQEVLNEDGVPTEPATADSWDRYLDRCFSQLEWWGNATKEYRKVVDPFQESPAFLSKPSARNAP